jgi:hypothetical protein
LEFEGFLFFCKLLRDLNLRQLEDILFPSLTADYDTKLVNQIFNNKSQSGNMIRYPDHFFCDRFTNFKAEKVGILT